MSQLALDYQPHRYRRISAKGIAVVLFAHVGVLAGLFFGEATPVAHEVSALAVRVIASTAPREETMTQPERPVAAARPVPVRTIDKAPLASTSPEASAVPAAAERPVTAATTERSVEAAVSPPRYDANYLDNPAPAYPALSRRLREQGKVLLRVFVEADGKPGRVEIKSGSGSTRLDQAAEQAVWHWKFIPARRGEEAVAAWVIVPLSFNLRD